MTYALGDRIERLAEPIVVLEIRRLLRHGLWPVAVVGFFALALPVACLLYPPPTDMMRDLVLFGTFGYLLLIMVLVPTHGARSISRERDMGTWDMLAVTPLRSFQIADQKILAATMPMLMLMVGGLPMAATIVVLHAASVFNTLALGVVLVLATIEVSSMSVLASSELAKSALIFSYLPAVLCLFVSSLLSVAGAQHTSSVSSELIDAQRMGSIIGLLLAPPLAIGIRLLQARRFPVTGWWQRAQLASMAFLWLLFVIWPWFRTQVAYGVPRCIQLFIICVTPAGSMQELVGNRAPSLPGLGSVCLPAYGTTLATLVLQVAAIALFRSSTVMRIERLRRTA